MKIPTVRKNSTTMSVRDEYQNYLEYLQRILMPNSNVDNYTLHKINRKLRKYDNLFISGAIDAASDDEMEDIALEPIDETDEDIKEKHVF